MKDTIYREDAIRVAKSFLHDDDEWFQEALASQIRMIPSADRPQEWIPTCDRLPSDSDYYLVTLVDAFGDTEICVVWYAHEKDYSGETGWREITDSDFVTAWMPLPLAYKGADDETN